MRCRTPFLHLNGGHPHIPRTTSQQTVDNRTKELRIHIIDIGLNELANSLTGFEPVIVEGDAENGKTLAASCIVCHGEDFSGHASERAPALSQLSDWYLQTQMQKFKHGIRGGDVGDSDGYAMKELMQDFSTQQMADLAAYIRTQNPKQPKATLDGDPVKGKELYNNCIACHQMDQHGNKELKAPGLAGLSDYDEKITCIIFVLTSWAFMKYSRLFQIFDFQSDFSS